MKMDELPKPKEFIESQLTIEKVRTVAQGIRNMVGTDPPETSILEIATVMLSQELHITWLQMALVAVKDDFKELLLEGLGG